MDDAKEALGRLSATGGADPRAKGEAGAYLTAWQTAALTGGGSIPSDIQLTATVPDFLNYARLLSTGQAGAMARLPGGLKAFALAGAAASPALLTNPLRAARTDFWLVAETLLRYDSALLPADFKGPVLLHSYLADFAFQFGRRDFVEGFFERAGRERAGVCTQQLPLALSCLARWNLRPAWMSFLLSPRDADGHAALNAARRSPVFADCRFIGEVESLPADLQAQYGAKHGGASPGEAPAAPAFEPPLHGHLVAAPAAFEKLDSQ